MRWQATYHHKTVFITPVNKSSIYLLVYNVSIAKRLFFNLHTFKVCAFSSNNYIIKWNK